MLQQPALGKEQLLTHQTGEFFQFDDASYQVFSITSGIHLTRFTQQAHSSLEKFSWPKQFNTFYPQFESSHSNSVPELQCNEEALFGESHQSLTSFANKIHKLHSFSISYLQFSTITPKCVRFPAEFV